MPPAMFVLSAKPLSGRYLSLAEREEIALLRVQDHSMQEIARRLGRAASTISQELRRNAATRSGGLEYRATTAQWHAERSARRSQAGRRRRVEGRASGPRWRRAHSRSARRCRCRAGQEGMEYAVSCRKPYAVLAAARWFCNAVPARITCQMAVYCQSALKFGSGAKLVQLVMNPE